MLGQHRGMGQSLGSAGTTKGQHTIITPYRFQTYMIYIVTLQAAIGYMHDWQTC